MGRGYIVQTQIPTYRIPLFLELKYSAIIAIAW